MSNAKVKETSIDTNLYFYHGENLILTVEDALTIPSLKELIWDGEDAYVIADIWHDYPDDVLEHHIYCFVDIINRAQVHFQKEIVEKHIQNRIGDATE